MEFGFHSYSKQSNFDFWKWQPTIIPKVICDKETEFVSYFFTLEFPILLKISTVYSSFWHPKKISFFGI